MANEFNLTPVVIGKEQMDRVTQLFADEPRGAEPILARELTSEIAVDYPDLITYEGLLDGTAPLFDLLPSFSGLPPEKRKLTNGQIISLFAVDEQGEPIKEGSLMGGFKREIFPSGLSATGAYVGARSGYALQSGIPPLSPWSIGVKAAIPVVTTTLGALGFYEAGKIGQDVLFGPEKPITPGSRAAYEMGKTLGAAGGWLPMPYMISKNINFGAADYLSNLAQGTKGPLSTRLIAGVERMLNKTGVGAKERPIGTALIESGAGTGAAGGTYLAESLDPGDASTRIMTEIPFGITGAILSDRIVSFLPNLKSIVGAGRKLISGGYGLKEKRQQAAAQRIVDILESEGENVDAVIEKLASKDFENILIDPATGKPITLTAGMKADSPALLAIESSLANTSPGLGKERTAKNVQANNALRNTIAALVATGNPEALQMAAQLAEDVFKAGMTNRLQRASANVLAAAERVGGTSPESTRDLSKKLFDIAQVQLSQARSQERNLWRDVRDVNISSFLDAAGDQLDSPNFINAWRESMPTTPEAANPLIAKLRPIHKFIERKTKELGLDGAEAAEDVLAEAADEVGSLTVNEAVEMRQVALNLARQLTAQQDHNAARIASNFAEGLLDDLTYSLPEGENVAYDIARAYSRSLNDTFTRSFAGKAFEKAKTGSQRIAPELLANRLMTGGSDATYLRIKEINDIGQFAIDNGLEGAENAVATIRGTQEMILRNARAAAFDSKTGEVNLKNLEKWMRENKDLLDTFPALRADLTNAQRANVVLQGRHMQNKSATDAMKGQVTFRDLLPNNTESPTFVVARALSSGQARPIKSLNNLLDVVKSAPEELRDSATSGLKHSILEWAMTKSGSTSRSFSPREMFDSLYSKIPNANSNVSVMDWMLQNNVIEERQANQLKKYLTEMVRLETMDSKGTLDSVLESSGPLLNLYLRITGSALGGKMASITGDTQSLIARSAASKYLQQVFNKIPESMKADVMTELMENPELLAAMMRKPRTEKEGMRVASVIETFLDKLGFTGAIRQAPRRAAPQIIRDSEIKPKEEKDIPGITSPLTQIDRTPAAPTVAGAAAPRPAPFVVAQAPVASSPPAQQARPADRSRFAAAFPSDITAPFIKQQGIETLLT